MVGGVWLCGIPSVLIAALLDTLGMAHKSCRPDDPMRMSTSALRRECVATIATLAIRRALALPGSDAASWRNRAHRRCELRVRDRACQSAF